MIHTVGKIPLENIQYSLPTLAPLTLFHLVHRNVILVITLPGPVGQITVLS
jgi:hypothetical protein